MSGQPGGMSANRSAAMGSDASSVTTQAPLGIRCAFAWPVDCRSGNVSLICNAATSTRATATVRMMNERHDREDRQEAQARGVPEAGRGAGRVHRVGARVEREPALAVEDIDEPGQVR